MLGVYTDDCAIELQRPVTPLFPAFEQRADNDARKGNLAAIVHVKQSGAVLAVAVFKDEWSEENVRVLRTCCHEKGIRLFAVDRMTRYSLRVIQHAACCDKFEVSPWHMLSLVPNATCPNCQSPMIHMLPSSRARAKKSSFYACASFGTSEISGPTCSGFTCSADEIGQYVGVMNDYLKEIRQEVRNASAPLRDSM
jgi:hypothetical protein